MPGTVNILTSIWCKATEKMGFEEKEESTSLLHLPSLRHTVSPIFIIFFVILSLICDFSSSDYSPIPVSREKERESGDWKLLSFQIHWRRYQKNHFVSNLDYIWFIENRANFKKRFSLGSVLCQWLALLIIVSLMSDECFHLKLNCLFISMYLHVHKQYSKTAFQ